MDTFRILNSILFLQTFEIRNFIPISNKWKGVFGVGSFEVFFFLVNFPKCTMKVSFQNEQDSKTGLTIESVVL